MADEETPDQPEELGVSAKVDQQGDTHLNFTFPAGSFERFVQRGLIPLLIGIAGTGGFVTFLRPSAAGDITVTTPGVTVQQVQQIVNDSIQSNNDVLMRKIEMALLRQRMKDQGITLPDSMDGK